MPAVLAATTAQEYLARQEVKMADTNGRPKVFRATGKIEGGRARTNLQLRCLDGDFNGESRMLPAVFSTATAGILIPQPVAMMNLLGVEDRGDSGGLMTTFRCGYMFFSPESPVLRGEATAMIGMLPGEPNVIVIGLEVVMRGKLTFDGPAQSWCWDVPL